MLLPKKAWSWLTTWCFTCLPTRVLRLRLCLGLPAGCDISAYRGYKDCQKRQEIRVTAMFAVSLSLNHQTPNKHTFVFALGLLFMLVSLKRNIRVARAMDCGALSLPKSFQKTRACFTMFARLLKDTFKILIAIGYDALHVACHFMLFCVCCVCRVVIAALHAILHVLHVISSVGISSVGRGLPTLYDSTTLQIRN